MSIKEVEGKVTSISIDLELLKNDIEELKQNLIPVNKDISELKLQKDSPSSPPFDEGLLITKVLESVSFRNAIETSFEEMYKKQIEKRISLENQISSPKTHYHSHDTTSDTVTSTKHEKKRFKSDTVNALTNSMAMYNNNSPSESIFEELNGLKERIDSLEKNKGKGKLGRARRNSFDDINDAVEQDENSYQEEIQKIWTTLNNLIDNFQDQISSMKTELYQNMKTAIVESQMITPTNANRSRVNINAALAAKLNEQPNGTSTGIDHQSILQEVEKFFETNMQKVQESVLRKADSQIEAIRTDMINHKIKIEQRTENIQQICLKKINVVEEMLGIDSKEPAKLKDKGETQTSLIGINEKLKFFDNGFKNINQNLSSFKMNQIKQENMLNSISATSQESFNSIWATIGIVNQRLDTVDDELSSQKGPNSPKRK